MASIAIGAAPSGAPGPCCAPAAGPCAPPAGPCCPPGPCGPPEGGAAKRLPSTGDAGGGLPSALFAAGPCAPPVGGAAKSAKLRRCAPGLPAAGPDPLFGPEPAPAAVPLFGPEPAGPPAGPSPAGAAGANPKNVLSADAACAPPAPAAEAGPWGPSFGGPKPPPTGPCCAPGGRLGPGPDPPEPDCGLVLLVLFPPLNPPNKLPAVTGAGAGRVALSAAEPVGGRFCQHGDKQEAYYSYVEASIKREEKNN